MTVKSLPLTLAVLLALGAGGVTAQDKVGTVHFPTSCSAAVQGDFERAVAMLHSFWFSASTAAFAAVAQADPGCGIAHWGVAMNLLGNPFGWPPSPKALADGWAAVERAKTAGAKTQRERDYISAIETFYKDADTVDHRTRALAYRQAMEQLTARYPDDREAAVFYALALNATALPTDKTYADQLKAAGILEKVFAAEPQHPGVAHYLIHSYDYPPIAEKGLTPRGVTPRSRQPRRTPSTCRPTSSRGGGSGGSPSRPIAPPSTPSAATSISCTRSTTWPTPISRRPRTRRPSVWSTR